jgi:L-lactate dehydrogenase
MAVRASKIAIIGAGSVGATIAYACMIRGVGTQIALYDINRSKVEAEALDLNHGLQFTPMATIEASDDIGICAEAAVVVVTAGAKQKPGQSRMELADANAKICRKLLPDLMRIAPEAILLMVTNPVDVITYIAQAIIGLPANRVFGSGTVLDSSRFRFLIARRFRVAVQNVHGYIVGEHGDSEIPLWSSANIATIPLSEWSIPGHGRMTDQDRQEVFEQVRTAAYQIIQGKGATNYAIGLSTARILEAVLKDENRVLPVSSRLDGYRGIGDVCLSVPSIVNRRGVDTQLPVLMTAEEEAGLRSSADTIREAVRKLGF